MLGNGGGPSSPQDPECERPNNGWDDVGKLRDEATLKLLEKNPTCHRGPYCWRVGLPGGADAEDVGTADTIAREEEEEEEEDEGKATAAAAAGGGREQEARPAIPRVRRCILLEEYG